jgi:hypothetical protein
MPWPRHGRCQCAEDASQLGLDHWVRLRVRRWLPAVRLLAVLELVWVCSASARDIAMPITGPWSVARLATDQVRLPSSPPPVQCGSSISGPGPSACCRSTQVPTERAGAFAYPRKSPGLPLLLPLLLIGHPIMLLSKLPNLLSVTAPLAFQLGCTHRVFRVELVPVGFLGCNDCNCCIKAGIISA